jgi:glutamine cyclotransferase
MILKIKNIILFYFFTFFLIATESMAQLVVEKRALSKANIIKKYKHDPSAFTQGLVYQNDHFFESTGGWGSSEIRKINKHTGKVINFKKLQSKYFGEGITIYDNKIFQVTWKSNKGFVYDINNFKLLDDFNIYGQGWGLTNDGQSLILSDGSEKIYYLNPKNFQIEKTISVSLNGNKLIYINELEFIRGEIWANIWKSNDIITVNPLSGIVTSIFDISKISEQTEIEDVANGIAWDKVNDKIFITGKNWNFIYLLDI